jgi:tetratricopeptide (TPR) repeat protein
MKILILALLTAFILAPALTQADPAAEVADVQELYAKCDILEQAEEYEKARAACQKLLLYENSYAVQLRLGWLNFKCGDFDKANEHYRIAAKECVDCVDPRLGLQLVAVSAGKWKEALAAGDRVLALESDNYWAIARNALAWYMRGKYALARVEYTKALKIASDNPEMLLGLGFTRIHQGAFAEGRNLCLKAAEKIGTDQRVVQCLKMAEGSGKLESISQVSTTYMQYTDPWNLENIQSISATSALNWPAGYGLWTGGSISETARRYESDDFQQTAVALGGSLSKNGWAARASGAWIYSSDEDIDDAPVAVIGAGRLWEKADIHLMASGIVYQDFNVYHFKAPIGYSPTQKLRFLLRPELILVGEHDVEIPDEKSIDAENLISWHAEVLWSPTAAADLFASAFYGQRRYAVDASGLSVWTGDDLFIAGYDLGCAINIGRYFQPFAYAHYQIGAQQGYRDHDFSLWGGTLGFKLTFHGG